MYEYVISVDPTPSRAWSRSAVGCWTLLPYVSAGSRLFLLDLLNGWPRQIIQMWDICGKGRMGKKKRTEKEQKGTEKWQKSDRVVKKSQESIEWVTMSHQSTAVPKTVTHQGVDPAVQCLCSYMSNIVQWQISTPTHDNMTTQCSVFASAFGIECANLGNCWLEDQLCTLSIPEAWHVVRWWHVGVSENGVQYTQKNHDT